MAKKKRRSRQLKAMQRQWRDGNPVGIPRTLTRESVFGKPIGLSSDNPLVGAEPQQEGAPDTRGVIANPRVHRYHAS